MATFTVTADICKNWEKTGRNEFMKFCRSRIAEAVDDGVITGSIDVVTKCLYEVIDQVLGGALKLDHAVSAFSAIVDIHPGVSSVLADVFHIKDLETIARDDTSSRDTYIALLGACTAFLDSGLLKERLDNDTLETVGTLTNKQAFAQRYVRLKTKLYYKQQKFNLLREESEGFAKLVSDITQVTVDPSMSHQVSRNIKALIGGFDLDPNRVLDIILEAFETAPDLHNFFVPLLQSYMCDPLTVCQVLGFKFQFYKEENIATPKSLHKVAAQLLQHRLVELDDLYPHLAPSDTDISKSHKQEIIDARQFARKMSMAVLVDKDEKDENKDKEKEKDEQVIDNQKIGLCEALLSLGDWTHAKKLLSKLPDFAATSQPSVASALCKLVESLLQPLYKKCCQPAGAKGHHVPPPPNHSSLGSVESVWDMKGVLEMSRCLGPYISLQPVLIWKMVRLGKALLVERAGLPEPRKSEMNPVFHELLSVIEQVILPSISMMPCNACLSEEVWTMMKMLPYHRRYCLYNRWINHSYGIHPPLIRTKAKTTDRAKYIMKRLTKENVKPSGRQLGKLSHSNPGVLFSYVLSQIQMYDNLIGPVVDSLKYLTSLSYDVLAYSVIEALANPEKERMKHDDTGLSLWMQSLASFCGAMFRKYNIELTGLLQFVANQLKVGRSFDLLILREVVLKMAGIEVTEEMTPDQLGALAGGELLRAEGGYFTQVRNTKRSSQRLKEALLEDDLAVTMCILMAQEKYRVVFKHDAGTHLKLVGMLYDQCQDTLVQLGGFLSNLLSIEDYSKHFPDLVKMVTSYHLTPESAFFLYRPMCTHAIQSKMDELRRQDKSSKSGSNRTQRYVQASQTVMAPMMESITSFHPAKVWDDISPQFYGTFWTLAMYDLHVPSASYEKEINKIKTTISQVDDNKDMASTKRKKEKERYAMIIDRLREEEKKQMEHCQRIEARLTKECETWFTARSTKNETITQFLQLCVFPRCCFSASDALYCAKFVLTVHQLRTPNFSTLLCYDRVFQDITYTVASCTENEASRYGRFLSAMMETVMRWHSNKDIYDRECGNFPGFVTVLRASGTESSNKADQLDYENFRHVCHKWQYKLTKAVVCCLESKEYTQIRNTLILLTKILPYFPLVQNLGQVLEKRVDKIKVEEKEKRPDIYALAMGYSGQLKARRPAMIPEDKFHFKEKPNVAAASASQSAEATGGKSASSASNTSISGSQSSTLVNGVSSKEDQGKDTDHSAEKSSSSKTSSSRDSSSKSSSGTKSSKSASSSQVTGKSSASKSNSAAVKTSSQPSGSTQVSSSKKADSKSTEGGKSKSRKEEKNHKDGGGSSRLVKEEKTSKEEKSSKEDKTPKEEKASKEAKVQRSSDKKSGGGEKSHRDDGKGASKDHKSHSSEDMVAPKAEVDGREEERGRKVEKKSSSHRDKTKEKDEGHRSSKERSQREESVASNSSQGSGGSSSRRESPAMSSADREHKRRRTDGSTAVSSASSPDLGREPSSTKHRRSKSSERSREREVLMEVHESERERSREKEKEKKSEKKRDHSAGDANNEAKRHKTNELGHESKSSKRSSLGDGPSSSSAFNGDRAEERDREREVKEEKSSRRESDVRERPAKEKKIKREPVDEDRDDDRHKSSSSRKRRP